VPPKRKPNRQSLARARAKRARRNRVIATVLSIAVIGAIAATLVLAGPKKPAKPTFAQDTVDPNSLPGILTGIAPWPSNTSALQQRLTAIGLPPASAMEGTALHIHQHLDIYIHRLHTMVPALVGIQTSPVLFAPIHTHDTSGVLHVESPVQRTFTLGEAFDVWGVRLTSSCIGGYCAGGANTLRVYANGVLTAGDPRALTLSSHEEIAIVFGTAAELPSIPASYRFPAGE
jgi:hypothetical protein